VRVGHRDELARTRVIEARRALALLVQHAFDARQRAQQCGDLGPRSGRRDVDVRDLVIRDRKGLEAPASSCSRPSSSRIASQPALRSARLMSRAATPR